MRVAIVADSHFDTSSRFDECVRVHDWIAEDIALRGDIDLVLHAGDVFERKSNPVERSAVAEWLKRCADVAPVVVVRGNHDAVGDLAIFSKLRTRHPVLVEEGVGIHRIATAGGPVTVAALAWPQVGHLHAALEAGGVEAAGLAAGDALRAVLRGIGQTLDGLKGPRILLAHAMVRGSRTSHGQPLVGCDLEVGLDDLALAHADLVALGHIHMPQSWDVPIGESLRSETHQQSFDVIYPGSPRRTAFGEVESKGYVIAELGRGGVDGWTPWERIETPCAPMLLIEARWSGSELVATHVPEHLVAKGAAGVEFRFRYTVASDQRDAARACAAALREEWLTAGAVSVKVEEEVIVTGTARAPEITSATTTVDKLHALWRAREDVPEPERAARLDSMVAGMEAA